MGKPWQQAFFAWVIRLGGRRLAYACVYVVAAWYVLLVPVARRRCRPFLDRRFPCSRNPAVRFYQTYRRIVAMGKALIDCAVLGMAGPGSLQIRFSQGDRLKSLLREGQGLIVVNSHVGGWQVAMSALGCLGTPVSIVMHTAPGDIDPRWFTQPGGDVPFSIVDPDQPMGGIMEMIGVLQRGQVLCIMADRVFGDDPNTLESDFLGAPVRFPVSPYRLASMRGTPIAVLFSNKTGTSTYDLYMAKVIRVPAGVGRRNEAYAPYVKEFAESLEAYAWSRPWQFFNFHNMWESPSLHG